VLDRHVRILYEFMFYIYNHQDRISWGIHGLPKVLLGPASLALRPYTVRAATLEMVLLPPAILA
jgi:hypothetical protein